MILDRLQKVQSQYNFHLDRKEIKIKLSPVKHQVNPILLIKDQSIEPIEPKRRLFVSDCNRFKGRNILQLICDSKVKKVIDIEPNVDGIEPDRKL